MGDAVHTADAANHSLGAAAGDSSNWLSAGQCSGQSRLLEAMA